MKDEYDIYREVVDSWGPDLQIIVLMEEAGELIQACAKIIRKHAMNIKPSDGDIDNFVEESVDTMNMINQMRHGWLNNPISYTEYKIAKLRRVAAWLEEQQ